MVGKVRTATTMKTAYTLLLIASLTIAGCATSPRMNRLSVGMSKPEVLAAVGRPASTAANAAGIEVLRYRLSPTGHDAFHHRTEEYFVRLLGGRVDCYGKMGDFGTSKDPTRNLSITNK
jgi:hypothetical protein